MIFFSPDLSPILRIASTVSFMMVTVAILLTVLRLIVGPSLPDRVVALDLLSMLAISFIAVYTMATERPVFLDAALALALVSFLGTVAFARYVEWWSDQAQERASQAAEEPQHD